MRKITAILLGSACLALAACGTQGDDELAENVEAGFDNMAEPLDQAAENATNEATEDQLEGTADVLRDTGDEAADSIDDNDVTNLANISTNAQ